MKNLNDKLSKVYIFKEIEFFEYVMEKQKICELTYTQYEYENELKGLDYIKRNGKRN